MGARLRADLAIGFAAAPASAVVILGMVGYFADVVHPPITAFVIVMEMTDNHAMLLPLMATAFIAHGVSRLICPQPIYRTLAQAFLTSSVAAAGMPQPRPAGEGVAHTPRNPTG